MEQEKKAIEAGKNDAKKFIANELIDYDPFVAMSDIHMVRKGIAVSYDSLRETLGKIDPELWLKIDSSATELEKSSGDDSFFDEYAQGFVEGVSIVWEQIKDKI